MPRRDQPFDRPVSRNDRPDSFQEISGIGMDIDPPRAHDLGGTATHEVAHGGAFFSLPEVNDEVLLAVRDVRRAGQDIEVENDETHVVHDRYADQETSYAGSADVEVELPGLDPDDLDGLGPAPVFSDDDVFGLDDLPDLDG